MIISSHTLQPVNGPVTMNTPYIHCAHCCPISLTPTEPICHKAALAESPGMAVGNNNVYPTLHYKPPDITAEPAIFTTQYKDMPYKGIYATSHSLAYFSV